MHRRPAIERFEPTTEDVQAARGRRRSKAARPPSALRLRLDATALRATALGELKELLVGFPGDSDVVIELNTSVGTAG